jgi:hypothetical protein
MIWREGFVYERFDLTESGFAGRLQRIGSLIIGIRQGNSRSSREGIPTKDGKKSLAKF